MSLGKSITFRQDPGAGGRGRQHGGRCQSGGGDGQVATTGFNGAAGFGHKLSKLHVARIGLCIYRAGASVQIGAHQGERGVQAQPHVGFGPKGDACRGFERGEAQAFQVAGSTDGAGGGRLGTQASDTFHSDRDGTISSAGGGCEIGPGRQVGGSRTDGVRRERQPFLGAGLQTGFGSGRGDGNGPGHRLRFHIRIQAGQQTGAEVARGLEQHTRYTRNGTGGQSARAGAFQIH